MSTGFLSVMGVATQILTFTLEQAGKAVGLEIFGPLAKKLFGGKDGQDGPSVIDAVKDNEKTLKEIVESLGTIKTSIKSLESDIKDSTFDIREALMDTPVNWITSEYTSYMNALDDLKESSKGPTVDRSRITDFDKNIAQNAFLNLSQIHLYLAGKGDSSLFVLANEHSTRTSNDLLTHYVKMRQYLLNYTCVQAKGIFLMNCANADQLVGTAGMTADIEVVRTNMIAQWAFFTTRFGAGLEKLTLRILSEPRYGIPISLRPENSTVLLCDYHHRVSNQSSYTNSPYWLLQSHNFTKNTDEIDVNGMYTFSIQNGLTGAFASIGGATYEVSSTGFGFGFWKLRPTTTDRVRLQWNTVDLPSFPPVNNLWASYELDTGTDYILKTTNTDGVSDNKQWFQLSVVEDMVVSGNVLKGRDVMLSGQGLENGDWRFEVEKGTGQPRIFNKISGTDKWRCPYNPAAGDSRFVLEESGIIALYSGNDVTKSPDWFVGEDNIPMWTQGRLSGCTAVLDNTGILKYIDVKFGGHVKWST